MTETIVPNDVKKGTFVVLKDGTMIKVLDNGKGISRRVEIDGDSGSEYVFEWDHTVPTPVEMPWGEIRDRCELIRQPGSYLLKKITIQRAGLL